MKLEVSILCNAIIVKNHTHGNDVRSTGRKIFPYYQKGVGIKGKIIKDTGNKK